MKHLMLFEEYQILNEIGDSSAKPFKYKQTKGVDALDFKVKEYEGDVISYEFKSNSGTVYEVDIEIDENRNKTGIIAEIDFAVKKKTPGGGTTYQTDDTNLGEQYSVMATINQIVINWIEKWQEYFYIDKLVIFPIKTKGDEDNESSDAVDSRRGKMYGRYIKKSLIPNLSKKYHLRVFNNRFEISPRFINPKDK